MPLITRTKNSLCFNFPAVLAEGSLGQTLLCSWNSSVGGTWSGHLKIQNVSTAMAGKEVG